MSAARWFLALALLAAVAGTTGSCALGDEPAPSAEDARPVGFPVGEVDSGARGRYFRIVTTAEPRTIEAEEPFKLIVRITTSETPQSSPHRIDLADMPAFAERFYLLEEDESYADQLPAITLFGLSASPLGNAPLLAAAVLAPQTEWVFVYHLKPKNAAITEVPVFTFAYYDPVSAVDSPEKRWHVPYAAAIPIRVQTRASTAIPLQAPEWAFQLAGGDLLERRELGTLPGSVVCALLLVLPPVLGLCWYLGWRRLYPDAVRLARLQRSRAARRALDRIAASRRGPPVTRADRVTAAVASYLCERYNFPAVEPTPSEVRGHLAQLACLAATIAEAEAFFRASDAARFLPATSADGLADAAEKLVLTLEAAMSEKEREARYGSLAAVVPLLLAITTALGAEPVFSSDVTNATLAERGVKSFEQGVRLRASSDAARPHFHDAAGCFNELRRRGANNPALYRNLGNAHLLADELGRAVFAYRRGLRFAPQDADLRAGLAEARQRVNYAAGTFGRPPAEGRPPWLPPLRAIWLFAGAAFCYALGTAFLTRWFMLSTRRPLLLGLAGMVVAAALSVFVAVMERGERNDRDHPLVVIVEDGVLLLKGDGTAFPARYETPVNQGVEARLLFERDGWLQIELSGGEVGWVSAAYAVVDRQ